MNFSRLISVAPMMDYTDRHYRNFMRLITKHTLLYTEMITDKAVIHGDRERLIGFENTEHPIALQLGGSTPELLIEAAKIAQDFGYDEINLNVGCPSDRVQSGAFGLCLMKKPELVSECISAMANAVSIPVTVKTRTGVDDLDSYEYLHQFIETVKQAPCEHFIIHARKGWLNGLSPKENRTIPPLQYERVYQLKKDFPDLEISINGGVETLEQADTHLEHVDAVMIGRAAYHNPYALAAVDEKYFDGQPAPSREEVVEQFIPYIEQQMAKGIHLNSITRHIIGLFQGQPGAKNWRRYISENAHIKGADVEVLRDALPQ